MLSFLLYLQLVFVVNQIYFKKVVTGIPGVAPVNIIFFLAMFFMRGEPEALESSEPFMKKPILYFYAALTIAFLWAEIRDAGNFMDDITYYKNALFGPFFYFLYLKCRQDEKATRKLLLWILLIAFVAAVQGLRQGIDYGFGKYNPMKRASGPFGEDWHMSNRAGVFYGMFIPMFVAFATFARGKLWRLAAVGATLVTIGATISTYSRQSYFMVLLSMAVLFARKSLLMLGVVAAAAVALVGYLPDSATQRVAETKQQNKAGDEELDSSTESRWEIWAGGMKMLAANPMGVGLNRWKGEIGNYCSHKNMDAHNFYVLTLGECGPLGEITLLFMLYSLFRLTGFVRKNRPANDPEAIALTLGFTVCTMNVAVGALYGSPTLEMPIMCPYWAMCGLLERYVLLKRQSEARGPGAAAPTPPSLSDRFPLARHIAPARRG